MSRETYAELLIRSDLLTSEAMASLLGVPGDRQWVKGAYIPPRKVARYHQHGWSMRTKLHQKDATPEANIIALLDRIEPFKGKVRSITTQADVLVVCVVYATTAESMVFAAKTIAAIAEMGAGFWIDLYVLPEDGDEEA